jgi:hypothetical protein
LVGLTHNGGEPQFEGRRSRQKLEAGTSLLLQITVVSDPIRTDPQKAPDLHRSLPDPIGPKNTTRTHTDYDLSNPKIPNSKFSIQNSPRSLP